jgi:Zn-dependent alcohol dehydrogenase
LFDHWRSGELPVERLISFYDLPDINRAAADSASGRTIKAVLRMAGMR